MNRKPGPRDYVTKAGPRLSRPAGPAGPLQVLRSPAPKAEPEAEPEMEIEP